MDVIDKETGEVMEDGDSRGLDARSLIAADGEPVAKRSGHVSDVIRMLEDGQFNADVSEKMRALAQTMTEYAAANKGAAKGKLTITMDLSLANGIFVITPNFTVKEPVQKRLGTALFMGDNGSLGRNPPSQAALFGDRKPKDPWADRETEVRDV